LPDKYIIVEENIPALAEYSTIPISFEVRTVYDVLEKSRGLGGFELVERDLDTPWVKDYDAVKGEGPERWAKKWDISRWGILSAFIDGRRAGGCAVAFDTDGINMLEGRKDMAVLWDLRVHPELRSRGIGSALFNAAIAWAAERGCSLLKVETQNINVPACKFYAKQECVLGAINRFGYRDHPEEVELVWYKEIQHPVNTFIGSHLT
jgi:GNAT superfamily N-acetyltransferase